MAKKSKKLPEDIYEKLQDLVSDLEKKEGADKGRFGAGEIELKLSSHETSWYVAYKTAM